jgi:prepilin-type N-terminal cleavage/methylation domain-containing protein
MKVQGHNFAGRKRGGFTFIELILALAMAAVLAMAWYATVRGAFKAQETAEATIAPSRTADLAMELIASDLQDAVTPNTTITNAQNAYDIDTPGATTTGNTTATSSSTGSGTSSGSSSSSSASNATATTWVLAGPFEGTQNTGTGGLEIDDLIFFTLTDGPTHTDGSGEIKMEEITLDQPKGTPSGQYSLVRKVTQNLTSEQAVTPDEEVLCRNVAGLTLQYFDGTDWNPTWDSTAEDNTLPAAVQITLNLASPTATDPKHTANYTRVFVLSSSTAAQDTTVNPSAAQ